MQTRNIISTAAVFAALLAISNSTVVAQQNLPIFSGGGIRTTPPTAAQGDTRALDFSRLGANAANATESAQGLFKLPKLELPKIQPPKITWPKWMQGNKPNLDGGNLLDGITQGGLFGAKDPNQPNFFERLNSRTKEIFGRTKEDLKQQALGSKPFESWNSLTKGLGNGIGNGLSNGLGNLNNAANGAAKAVQPPLRQAQRLDVQPKVRY